MVNLLLTMDCSLDCPYCFAMVDRTHPASKEMTLDEAARVISRLDPTADPVQLLGGEPTLHSCYSEVLRFLKNQGFEVVVFTNGLQPALRLTGPIWPDRILLNLNTESCYRDEDLAQISQNLAVLGERTVLGFNIFKPDFDLSFHRRMILDFDLLPVIRLGIAQPILGGSNVYLPDADLAAAHRSVVLWAEDLAREGIRLHLDCGFMRCLFSEQDLEALVRAGTALNFQCTSVMDIGPGLTVRRCFAFSGEDYVSWYDFDDLKAIKSWFEAAYADISPGCEDCVDYQRGWCRGGCLARICQQLAGLAAPAI
jgi:hypothetical protein